MWFNPAAGNSAPDSRSLTPPLPPRETGRKREKRENFWVDRQFNKVTKEILILIILLIMSIQNKLYTVFSPPDDQLAASP